VVWSGCIYGTNYARFCLLRDTDPHCRPTHSPLPEVGWVLLGAVPNIDSGVGGVGPMLPLTLSSKTPDTMGPTRSAFLGWRPCLCGGLSVGIKSTRRAIPFCASAPAPVTSTAHPPNTRKIYGCLQRADGNRFPKTLKGRGELCCFGYLGSHYKSLYIDIWLVLRAGGSYKIEKAVTKSKSQNRSEGHRNISDFKK